MSKQKDLERMLCSELEKEDDIPPWDSYPGPSNFKFNRPVNGMEFDIAWPEYKVAIEVNGGQWASGKMGHNSGSGVERDARKQNWAILKGWLLLWLVTDHIEKQMRSYAIPTIREALLLRGAPLIDYQEKVTQLFDQAEELV